MNQQEAIEAAKALPWAKWVAMDGDGSWYAYSLKPELSGRDWYRPESGDERSSGEMSWLGVQGIFPTPEPIEVPR